MYPYKLEFGIKNKSLLVFVVVFMLILSFTAYFGISTLKEAKQASLAVGNTILLEQNRTYFKNYTNSQNETLELLIKTIEDDVISLQDFATRLFANEQWINTKRYWNFQDHLKHLSNNQLVESSTDVSTLWSPTWMTVDDNVLKKIELSAFMNEYFEPLLRRNENTVANYFVGKEGFIRYYPRIDMLAEFEPDFNTLQAIFFKPATPENNPKRQLIWTPLYKDPAGLGWMISAIAPIYVENRFIGIVGTDMTLAKLVKHYIKDDRLNDSYSILLDQDFRPIALPRQATREIYGQELADNDQLIAQSLLQYPSDFKSTFNKIRHLRSGFERIELEGKVRYMSYVKLDKLNWVYANILSEKAMLSVTKSLSQEIDHISERAILTYTLPVLLMFIVMFLLISWLINRFLRPVVALCDITRTIAYGHFEQKIDVKASDEVGVLVSNFRAMQTAIVKQKQDLLEFNTSLQEKVEERTEAIEASNEALQTMVHNLKYMQEQMVESEKMASLGTLTAGVAHEINNPTNFVHVSVQNLQADVDKLQQFLFGLLEAEQGDDIHNSFVEHFEPLSGHIRTILDGTGRIRTIVRNLKTFTHPDAEEKKRLAVADALDSTVTLVMTKFFDLVKFETDFVDNPVILCYPSELNQVFMNLIINACEAIRDANKGLKVKGTVKVGCRAREQSVQITIEDNGCGMTDVTKQRLFEPFYTTKDVGEGTGLGMSISYGIIQKHEGELIVESTMGIGTLFTLSLPICDEAKALPQGTVEQEDIELSQSVIARHQSNSKLIEPDSD